MGGKDARLPTRSPEPRRATGEPDPSRGAACAPGKDDRLMGKYLYTLQYTSAGLGGTVKEGFVSREAFFRKTVEGLGGKTEAAYWAYGDVDIFIVVELPSAEKATALSLALGLTGSFRVTTTTLVGAAEMDAAATVSYTHLRAHETRHDLVCRLLLEK